MELVYKHLKCTGEWLVLMQVDRVGALIVVAAATVANFFESYLGASLQGNYEWLTNDVVNMIQISVAALIAILLQSICC